MTLLKRTDFFTPIGSMLVLTDETKVYCVTFTDLQGLSRMLEKIVREQKAIVTEGTTPLAEQVIAEFKDYFAGTRSQFTLPLQLNGTSFQKRVWHELERIPYGKTVSYQQQAEVIGKPTAVRAVANANGANRFAIVLPCHRVIGSDGFLRGYAGGVERKQWLLEHEKKDAIFHQEGNYKGEYVKK